MRSPCHAPRFLGSPAAPSAPRIPRFSAAFTLAELLVVLTVMMILASLGMSALTGSRGAAALSQGGGMVADLAMLARQNAVSQNAPTALVLLKDAPGDGARLNAKAVTVLAMGTDQKWRQVEKWSRLPDSIVAINSTEGVLPALPSGQGTAAISIEGMPLDPSLHCDAYVFYPDGRLATTSGAPAKIRVQAEAGQAENFYELIFNAATGTYKVHRP